MHKGDRVRVTLGGSTGMTWSVPTLSAEGVLQPTVSGEGTNMFASFDAVGDGKVTISSEQACSHTQPGHACPMVIVLWHAQVTVA